jgi:hypothetical protein
MVEKFDKIYEVRDGHINLQYVPAEERGAKIRITA